MLALVCVALLGAAPDTDLKRGEDLFQAFKWAEARTALTKARAAKGLTREQLLRILELTGVAAAQQRQVEAAQAAFTELVTLDPTHQLEAEYAPRVMTPFFEAKRVVEERGALTVAPEVKTSGESVEVLTVRVTKDPLKAARAVRFRIGDQVKVVPLAAGAAALGVSGSEVSWSAQLLGDNEVELYRVEPRVDRPPPPVVTAPPPPPTPAPEPSAVTAQPRRSSGLRPVSIVVFGAGLVAGGVGGFFGWRSGDAFSKLARLMPDGDGRVSSISERDAYALRAQGSQSALVANALYIGAGVLAVVALIVFLVSG